MTDDENAALQQELGRIKKLWPLPRDMDLE